MQGATIKLNSNEYGHKDLDNLPDGFIYHQTAKH